jgi:hypothetical protein
MTKLPRWWWISMALWPVTGIPLIAYGYIFFGHLPLLGYQIEGWSASATALTAFAIYHPLILLPFALVQCAIGKRKPNA